ncbi:hypothetical protein LTR08_004237 [Meristemomyces frigidus]|nr:hypothetical protein LTR08_004237 [Meristemomyces frigidus]
MKTVCIVGAGPAGLVAAKTFLQTGGFHVTVYEKCARLGGIWALDEDTTSGFLSPQTPTNLSRFTVAFSDLDWNSVDFQSKHGSKLQSGSAQSSRPPMFPTAWQVNRYLETYRRRFIPDGVIHYGSEVVKAQQTKQLAPGAQPIWRITIADQTSVNETKSFDYLLVASGFFSKPRSLQQDVPGLVNTKSENAVKAIHSARFKTLEDLFPGTQEASGKDILVIGGGNSSGEAAAAVAMQLSDTQWSPDRARRKRYQGCRIKHVVPRPLYPLPPYVEYESQSRSYLPIDLKLYNLAQRSPGPIEASAGPKTQEITNIIHSALQTMVGGNQTDLGCEALVISKDEDARAPYVALAESYTEFVRSGMIEVVSGRVTEVSHSEDDVASAIVTIGDQMNVIENIGAIVCATGYTPSAALEFLTSDVKRALQFDSDSMRLPLILDQWQTGNDAVQEIALLGFYEGPYWPMMEMQARLTAERWTTGSKAPQRPFEAPEKLLQLRGAMRDKARDVPQYWFNDHVGYMDEVASHIGLERNNEPFGEREGLPSPARYMSEKSDRSVNASIMQDLHKTWHDCVDSGKYVARAAFRALQGDWEIVRRITSEDRNFSGTLSGRASFHPRFPTQDGDGKSFDLEHLYVEHGTFTSASGLDMTATRRYVYRYSEADDQLSVWFVKPEDDLMVDYLFHKLDFVSPSEARKAGACIAKADHLCVDDMYWTEYTLPLKAIALHEFEIKHAVKGPSKDYVAKTQYNRPALRAL